VSALAERDTDEISSVGQPPRPGNALLTALPLAELQRVMPTLEIIPLRLRDVLNAPGERLKHVYFPTAGFLSVLNVMADGSMVEVATIGKEGAAGIFEAMDGSVSPSATMVQAEADICYRMTREAFRLEMDRRGEFYNLLTDYTHALIGLIMQSAACNALHSVEQRLARWLLMAHDRADGDEFQITQEFLALMLCVYRPSVSVAARTLQRAGMIRHGRGRMTVLDRGALEDTACDCYAVVKRRFDRLLGP
jgi:CRP-like cAMP-binding protein